MKYLLRTVCFLIIIASSSIVVAQNTYISCEKSVHNFGTIAENGGKVSHQFLLINKGKAPLIVSGVSTSCGCTTSDYPRKAVAAGDTARIKITFDPKNRPGTFMKMIRVYTKNSTTPYILSIRGVVKKEESK